MAGIWASARSHHHDRIARDLGAVGNILIPVFFAQIGINTDLDAMVKPEVLGIAAVLSVVAVIGKLAAALGTVGTRADRLLVGLGMIPRGEVGLIFASIGLTNGVLDGDQYGALLIVVLFTTVATPPLLRWRLGKGAPPRTPRRRPHRLPPSPRGLVDGGGRHEVRLNGDPLAGGTHRAAGPAHCSVGGHGPPVRRPARLVRRAPQRAADLGPGRHAGC